MNTQQVQPKEWIVQRCLSALKNEWQDWRWSDYEGQLLTRDEVEEKLKTCCKLWPDEDFRGHRVLIDGVRRQ